MSEIEHGGPAFPAPDAGEQDFGLRGMYSGMTLRDYFAAKAMQGMLSGPAGHAILDDKTPGGAAFRATAAVSYEVADAMLAAREAS